MISRAFALLLLAASLTACGGAEHTSTTSALERAAPSAVRSNCLAAVTAEAGVAGAAHVRTEVDPSTALSNVYVGVPGAEAPWRCTATPAGEVLDVRDTGSEAAL